MRFVYCIQISVFSASNYYYLMHRHIKSSVMTQEVISLVDYSRRIRKIWPQWIITLILSQCLPVLSISGMCCIAHSVISSYVWRQIFHANLGLSQIEQYRRRIYRNEWVGQRITFDFHCVGERQNKNIFVTATMCLCFPKSRYVLYQRTWHYPHMAHIMVHS